jgi:H+/Cl- antiporter ClcA
VTGGGLPVTPDLAPLTPTGGAGGDGAHHRLLAISGLSCLVACAAGLAAQLLTSLIALITNGAFFGRVSLAWASPALNHLGAWVVLVPVAGAVLVGLLARFGHAGIRGHGIPEAMEQILTNQSRIPARLTILKPLSAAISIGTGGPFGAEGPIIATGGALGSLLGQFLRTTAVERKVLLAAGAAAGMAATFGCPVAAVLLAVELLLFEYRARSIIPVALAAAVATGVRIAFVGSAPVFAMSGLAQPSDTALVVYVVLGGLVGLFAVWVTDAVYWVEEQFERLPIHWMWWPAIGAVAVGLIGWVAPRTLGVGYENIRDALNGAFAVRALVLLFVLKFLSWVVALGSGTSGGTMAPLFTIGGGLGAALGAGIAVVAPRLGVDPRMAALVGMAAMFAGASRAFLASVVLAFETTRQPLGLLPLLGGCTAAVLVSYVLMRDTIMTRKIARRGVRVVSEFEADYLGRILVRDRAARPVVTVAGTQTLAQVRGWLASGLPETRHQGFPVVDETGRVIGVVTRRDLLAADDGGAAATTTLGSLVRRAPITIGEDATLREAADRMVVERVGRLVVVGRAAPGHAVGIITRSDLLEAHAHRLDETHHAEQSLDLRSLWAD